MWNRHTHSTAFIQRAMITDCTRCLDRANLISRMGNCHTPRPSAVSALSVAFVLSVVAPLCALQAAENSPTFEHEIKPLLEQKCFECHGNGKTKGGLSLASLTEVVKGSESGPVVVPGNPEASLLYSLVESGEMPREGARLSKEQVRLIHDWIEKGQFPSAGDAKPKGKIITEEDRQFWSFVPPVRPELPELPETDEDAAARTSIDHFILRKHKEAGLKMKQEADRRTLIHRLYFDMLGLPPTPQEIERFVASEDPKAWVKLVERVLESPHYGERWGRHWMDVAGYAESSLIVGDFVRPDFWRYRDYVIDSFNDDKPYDQFVIEQLAGDELVDWRGADAFTPDMIEKLVATGFLRCAPDGTDNQLITQEDKRYDAQQTAVEVSTKAIMGLTLNCVRCHDHKYDPILQEEYFSMISFFQPAYDPENWISGNLNTFGAGPVRAIPLLDKAGREQWERHCQQVFDEQAETLYQIDYGIENSFRDRYISDRLDQFDADRREALRKALKLSEREREQEEIALVFEAAKELAITSKLLRATFPEMNDRYKEAQTRMSQQRKEFNASQPELIWGLWDVSTQPSPAWFLSRGDYHEPTHEVDPGVMMVLDGHLDQPFAKVLEASVNPTPHSTGRRLALARWLTQPDHPLTARVMVNRIWQYHFGNGIVYSTDDFGKRGSPPTHPELLDWLAVEFVENGWSIKHMHRLILNSTTFRQAAGTVGAASLLSGFPRRRLDAELIRDRMLAVSGLLDETTGGESVPTVEFSAGTHLVDPEHPGRYRRSVYLTTQRSTQPTILKVFDGPVMETNWPHRHSSTVAPQALTLMNHPFVREAAEALANRIVNCPGEAAEDRTCYAFQLVYGRDPRPEERQLLKSAGGENSDWTLIAHALLSSNEFLYVD